MNKKYKAITLSTLIFGLAGLTTGITNINVKAAGDSLSQEVKGQEPKLVPPIPQPKTPVNGPVVAPHAQAPKGQEPKLVPPMPQPKPQVKAPVAVPPVHAPEHKAPMQVPPMPKPQVKASIAVQPVHAPENKAPMLVPPMPNPQVKALVDVPPVHTTEHTPLLVPPLQQRGDSKTGGNSNTNTSTTPNISAQKVNPNTTPQVKNGNTTPNINVQKSIQNNTPQVKSVNTNVIHPTTNAVSKGVNNQISNNTSVRGASKTNATFYNAILSTLSGLGFVGLVKTRSNKKAK